MTGVDVIFPLAGKRVWVAGHRGMVGSALVRRLQAEDCLVVTVDKSELDLRRQGEVETWMADSRPEVVFLAAARVGGILANHENPVDFLHDNLMIEVNILHSAWQTGVTKLLLLGSSCIYPRGAEQPITESALLTGPLEPTNEWYAIAKIAGIKLCQAYRRQYGCDFISAMPTNLYGPGDNYDARNSHVLPALLRKAYTAKRLGQQDLEVWGSGTPRREFMHVDDCADALVHIMKVYSDFEHINVGVGYDLSIDELARLVMKQAGVEGRIVHDRTKPDGTPRKLLDGARLQALGWRPSIPLETGIAQVYSEMAERFSREAVSQTV
jgi:GDP-L-fucose synthase